MPRDRESVLDMLLAAEAIDEFIGGATFETFLASREKQSAVIHQFLIFGEACKRLSVEFRESHGTIPWTRIAGMRDKMIHAYDEIDLKIVWDAAKVELPPLVEILKRVESRD